MGSHGYFLQLQGGSDELIEHLSRGALPPELNEAERALLGFVELLTRSSWRTTREDLQRLRDLGWTDKQLAEAVYVTALFAFYNRVADAFGLADPGYRRLGGIPDPAYRGAARGDEEDEENGTSVHSPPGRASGPG